MKKLILVTTVVALLTACAFAQASQADLEKVLNLLDKTSETFKAVQADFEWDQYLKVVPDEQDIQSGVMYFKRTGANVDVAADITSPAAKKMVFKNGEVQLYTPKTGEIERHNAGKNRKSFESFLALGFGGRGHDLTKDFDVSYKGTDTVNGKPTYKLELVPKAPEARRMFPLITLWINQQTGMSERQKLDQGEGDSRTAIFTNIKVNPPKLPPDAFDLKAR